MAASIRTQASTLMPVPTPEQTLEQTQEQTQDRTAAPCSAATRQSRIAPTASTTTAMVKQTASTSTAPASCVPAVRSAPTAVARGQDETTSLRHALLRVQRLRAARSV